MAVDNISSNDVQRLFLQAIMSRRYISEKLARILHEKCVEVVRKTGDLDIEFQETLEEWNSFIARINKALNPLDLEFRNAMDEVKGEKYCLIINTKGDEIAQMATDYTPAEIAYFKAIVEQILLAPNHVYSLSSLAALREVSYLKTTMTKTQAEVVLGSFIANGWLLKSKKGRYSLSTRTIIELEHYLKAAYPDELLECTICSEVVTKGVRCHKANCNTYLHNHCYNGYKRTASTCPSCRDTWTAPPPVGEAAAREGQDHQRRVHRRDDEDDEDLDVTQDISQYQDDSQTQIQSQDPEMDQREKRAKGTKSDKGRKMATETDEEPEPSQDIQDAMDIDNLTQDRRRANRTSRRKR